MPASGGLLDIGDLGASHPAFNYVGLLIGALVANWAFAGIHLPLAGDFQAPIIFALAGMSVTGIAMIALMRRLELYPRRKSKACCAAI